MSFCASRRNYGGRPAYREWSGEDLCTIFEIELTFPEGTYSLGLVIGDLHKINVDTESLDVKPGQQRLAHTKNRKKIAKAARASVS
jgi:hypothetical protein